MYPIIITTIVCLVSIVIVLSLVLNKSARAQDSFNNQIYNKLQNNGYQLIDIKTPRSLRKGFYPKPGLKLTSNIQKKGLSKDRTKYRVVRYKDKGGKIKQSWIKVNKTGSNREKITWIPEIK